MTLVVHELVLINIDSNMHGDGIKCATCLKYSVLIFVEKNTQNATSGG